MPADHDPRAVRCSLICTQRAQKDIAPPDDRRCRQCGVLIPVTAHAAKKYCSSRCRLIASELRRRTWFAAPRAPSQAMDEHNGLRSHSELCAALTPWRGRGTGGNCQEPPIVEARWHFPHPQPHVSVLRLCEDHRAQLAFREQYRGERPLAGVSVGLLYDASVED